jgi:radical SAM protein
VRPADARPAARAGRVADGVRRLHFDAGARPFLVLLELTRSCELACAHCRADAIRTRDPDELAGDEVRAIFEDLASLGSPRPIVVLTGGDPFQRSDLTGLVAHGARLGLTIAVSPAGTPRATAGRFAALREAGAGAVSLSIDAGNPRAHDAFRRAIGSFDWTVAAVRAARAAGLRVQVNTTASAETVLELPGVAHLVASLGASLWSVFFLVPVGRGARLGALGAPETEDVLAFLDDVSGAMPVKTTEAPQFRRFATTAELRGVRAPRGPLYDELHGRLAALGGIERHAETRAPRRRPPLAVGDARGVVFVSHVGDVSPSGFLPLVAGNVRETPLTQIYAQAPLLAALRDPDRLRGRCGRCELREICGGSRAQAWARTGDPFAEDPSCSYEPPVEARGGRAAVAPA